MGRTSNDAVVVGVGGARLLGGSMRNTYIGSHEYAGVVSACPAHVLDAGIPRRFKIVDENVVVDLGAPMG